MKKYENLSNFALAVLITAIVYFFVDVEAKYLVLVFLVSYPWKIKENVYSLFGGINAEGNVYSLITLFQKAGKDAFCIISLCGVQISGEKAISLIGISGYQKSDDDAWFGAGISIYQNAKYQANCVISFSIFQLANAVAVNFLGISWYQKSLAADAVQVVGLSFSQFAKDKTGVFFGISVYQSAGIAAEMLVGISVFQFAEENAVNICGISIIQVARKKAYLGLGIVLIQKAEEYGINQKKAHQMLQG